MTYNIALWFIGGIVSISLGTLLGCLSHNQTKNKKIAKLIRLYVTIARSIPLYIHLLCIYFIISYAIGINFSPFTASLLAIICCVTAYAVEIIRSCINAIPIGQWEAASVLGYSYRQTLNTIILPQIIPQVMPLIGNLSEELFKSTAIVSAIGVLDITRTGMNIIALNMNPEIIYLLIAVIYIITSLSIQNVLNYAQKWISHDYF
jgi:His/Glu/Gln/Arg/opine family amino acid ABC transporter permease subunit